MILVVDVGNTNIVWGISDGKELLFQMRTETNRDDQVGDFVSTLNKLTSQIPAYRFSAIFISSVVPQLETSLASALQSFSETSPLFLTTALIPVGNSYNPPEGVGSDRLVSAYAAVKLYKLPALIIDLGTATTFNVVSSTGYYVGGAIADGLGTGTEALFAKAARLSHIELSFPDKLIGTTGEESLAAGLVGGHLAMIERMAENIEQEYDEPFTVLVTGGWSNLLVGRFPSHWIHDADLTLKGIILTAEHHKI
ncbi:MAG: type III pantothenate kinase [bacterium]